jgi:hypothetical protein
MAVLAQTGAYNVSRRVVYRGGWIGLFGGESQGRAVDRVLRDMNGEGYRVVFVIRDRWNFFRLLVTLIVGIVSLGFIVRTPNLLIIGEPIR